MTTNDSQTRIVRAYASDIASGDVIVNAEGAHQATVDSAPEIDWAAGKVSFQANTENGPAQITYGVNRVIRIEIVRRVS